MREPIQLTLERVSPEDMADFQEMVEEYWQELMPHAAVVKELDQRKLYFAKCFTSSQNTFCSKECFWFKHH